MGLLKSLRRYIQTLWRKPSKPPEGIPLPRTIHATLAEAATRHKRIIVVGDVHGCALELQQLLDRCQYRSGADILVSVGDLVNKGTDSSAVLKLASELGAVAVRGNHEEKALAAYQDARAGIAVKPRLAWVHYMSSKQEKALRELPFSLRLPAYGVIVVHAGMVPGKPLEEQNLGDLNTMRDVVPAAVLEAPDPAGPKTEVSGAASQQGSPEALPPGWDWDAVVAEAEAAGRNSQGGRQAGAAGVSTSPTGSGAPGVLLPQLRASEKRNDAAGRAWASVWRGPNHVLFGHDAGRRLQLEPCATGLDGGCVYGGRLYAAVLPPLDEAGKLEDSRLGSLPSDTEVLVLCTGLVAHLVSVPAVEVHVAPKAKQLPH